MTNTTKLTIYRNKNKKHEGKKPFVYKKTCEYFMSIIAFKTVQVHIIETFIHLTMKQLIQFN